MNRNRLFTFFILLLSVNAVALAEMVDPRNQAQWQTQQAEAKLNLSSWPVTRISQLETLRTQLRENIVQLPRHCPVTSDHHLGYHSSLNMNNGQAVPKEHHIEFRFSEPKLVRDIALIPAFNPLMPYGGSYGFPKRFKIEGQKVGQTTFEEIVNWLTTDFPNPGAYPVFFNEINQQYTRLKFTAPSQLNSNAKAHFALGEMYIWADDELTGAVENIARSDKTKVNVSGGYHQSTKWHVDYLTDKTTGLGFPINEQQVNRKDLLIIPAVNEALAPSLQINIDLEKPINIARIDFWPAKPRHNILLTDFGFPENIAVEVADNPEFNQAQIIKPQSKGEDFGTLFSMPLPSKPIQYLRIRMENLQALNNQLILGLGEIALYHANGQLTQGGIVTAKGIPEQYREQLPRLVDGYAWGRKIVPEREWIMGLAQRRPLDQQLKNINNELALAHEYWDWLLSRIVIGAVIALLLMIIVAVLLFQRAHRQALLLKQGERINRDLHDEVGSSLGSITLLADELASAKSSLAITDDLNDLSLMAREANASLREVVWHNDGKVVLLQPLLHSLFERSERVLRGVNIEKSLPENCPAIEISLTVKRHLTMFFKEVIHNCARHAQATTLMLTASFDKQYLLITITDNGNGFKLSQTSNGWGLKNLAARAEELDGNIHISSEPGQGTSVQLRLALACLSKELKHGYKTSN